MSSSAWPGWNRVSTSIRSTPPASSWVLTRWFMVTPKEVWGGEGIEECGRVRATRPHGFDVSEANQQFEHLDEVPDVNLAQRLGVGFSLLPRVVGAVDRAHATVAGDGDDELHGRYSEGM